MSNEAIVNHHFQTPIWLFEKPEWVNKVNKACDKYIKEAYKRDKKGKKDFGHSYHSSPLTNDPKLKELHDWVGSTAHNFLDGKLKNKEDISDGLLTAPASLVKILNGLNLGKQLVKI